MAAVIITVAVAFSLLRIFLPQINYFKYDIENWIESTYQVEIEFKRIDAEWGPLGPIFSASNFQIKSKNEEFNLITVDKFSIHFDGLNSLTSKNIITDRIDVYGANLNLVLGRKLDVRFDVLEKSEDDEVQIDVEGTSRLLLNTLFAQKHLTLSQSKISLETLSGQQFNYNLEEFTVRNFNGKHQLSGLLKDESSGQVEIIAEIIGDPSLTESETNLFLQGKNVQLKSLPIYSESNKIRPDSGVLNWRVWSDWENGRWQNAVGDFIVEDAKWFAQDKSATIIEDVEYFKGKLNWQFKDSNNGTFLLREIDLKRKDESIIRLPALYLLFEQQENFDLQWDLISQDLDIEPLIKYLDASFLDDKSKDNTFKKSALKLNVNTLGVRFSKQDNVWQSPALVSDFSELS